MKKIIALPLSFVLFFACSSSKKPIENKSKKDVLQSFLPDSIYRFNVSFISIGSGIDHKAKEQFVQFIQQFDEKNNVKINKEITHWGREGETDYCLKLNELNKQQQEQFIKETKALLKNSTRVRYNENSICRYNKSK